MNKKILFSTLLGIMTGGLGLVYWTLKKLENENKIIDIDNTKLSLITVLGAFYGGTTSFLISNYCFHNIEEENLQNDPDYREFFERQRMEPNSNQLVNESTPLLQEHIININNEENLLNIDTPFNNSRINIL